MYRCGLSKVARTRASTLGEYFLRKSLKRNAVNRDRWKRFMKKALEVGGILLMSAILAVGLLYFFKPEALKKFSKYVGAPNSQEMKIADFELLDHKGRWHDLHRQTARAVVLISTVNGCPAVKEAAPLLKTLRD